MSWVGKLVTYLCLVFGAVLIWDGYNPNYGYSFDSRSFVGCVLLAVGLLAFGKTTERPPNNRV
jgi:hypothetical protein